MATKAQFHSFCRLVRMMHNKQQESYAVSNSKRELVAQCKQLEIKVSGKFREYPTGNYHMWYDWQERFILLVKKVRAEQELYYSTRYDAVKMSCRSLETQLGESIRWIENQEPQVFHDDKPVQATLL